MSESSTTPGTKQPEPQPGPNPSVPFDPALFEDAALPADAEAFRVEGVVRHLRRYGGLVAPRQAIARLEDARWLAAWDAALAGCAGERLLLRGSELGMFALRALHHGARHVTCLEHQELAARVTGGMVQKHFLANWHERYRDEIASWTEEQRRASFEASLENVAITVAGENAEETLAVAPDCVVFPDIDHSLLGTGIVPALRSWLDDEQARPRVLPAGASVHVMAIQWTYPEQPQALHALNALRWSPYPQALELDDRFWTALTEPVCLGRVDFAAFEATRWQAELPVLTEGRVDALLFWFDLELGPVYLSSAPGSGLWLKPAVQYTDPVHVHAGSRLPVSARVDETRLSLRTEPPPSRARQHMLPGWYIPMLGDTSRHAAYHEAIGRAVTVRGVDTLALNIGGGCGTLCLALAEAGAQVVGCEPDAGLQQIGREIIGASGLHKRISWIGKDCRQLSVPDDLPRRADLVVFDNFDCSLIGEGILHFLAYAREHLLTPDARCLPARARLRAMLIEHRLDRIWDIDTNLLNPYRTAPSFINVDAAHLQYRALSAAFDVFAFDFSTAGPEPVEHLTSPVATAAGQAGAVLFWFELDLDEQAQLSNDAVAPEVAHWKQGLQALPEMCVEPGMAMPLRAAHDGSGLRFGWQPDALPREAMSSLPRWDPRWLAASADLEQQTQQLVQHCRQNPDEYRKVAAIAQRLAVDPAAYQVDPGVAQRFMSLFL